jgi:predicted phosphodiesterase
MTDNRSNQITIFSDIHANLPALEAVLADIEARDLDNLYCLGDLVGFGTSPNQVVAAIRDRDIPTVQGNYDQGVGNSSDDCGCAYRTSEAKALGNQSIAWTNQHTSDENKAYLSCFCVPAIQSVARWLRHSSASMWGTISMLSALAWNRGQLIHTRSG